MTSNRPPFPLGRRFHRALTEAELERITATTKRSGPEAGIIELWDILLTAAEGISFAEARTLGRQFNVRDYAIPEQQETQLLAIYRRHRKQVSRSSIDITWLGIGPATYDEKNDDAATSPDGRQPPETDEADPH